MTFHCSNQSFFWQPYMWCQLWLFSLRAVTNAVKWAMYGHVWQVIRLCLARICIWVDEKSVWPCWHFLLWHFSWIFLLLYHEELKAMNFSLIHSLIIRLDFLADVYVLSDLLTLAKIFIHLDCMHLYAQMHDTWKKNRYWNKIIVGYTWINLLFF